jgi:hypothetical protein
MSRAKPDRVPNLAFAVSLRGEAACALADEIGVPVMVPALRPGGYREVSTAEARAFFAGQPTRAKVVWLETSYDVSMVLK